MEKMQISNRNYYLLLSIIFGGYFIFGLSENIKGPAIPQMQADFFLSEMQIGILLALNALCYMVACAFTGLLIKKIGGKAANFLAFGGMAIAGVFLYFSFSYGSLAASYALLYLANGMLEIVLGVISARVFTKNTGMMMNLSHFFYGASSAIAPISATALIRMRLFGDNSGWHSMYMIMLALSLLPLIPAFFSKFPSDTIKEEDRLPMREYIRDPAAWLIVAIFSFGVVSEMAVGGWLVNFLEKTYQWNTEDASGMLSLFFVVFTLSRLFLSPFIDKIGLTRSLAVLSGISGILTIAGVITGESGAFLFALAGAGIAPIYPTVMALLARRYQSNVDTAISFSVTLMGIFSIIGNFLVGAIVEVIKDIFTATLGMEKGLALGMQAGYAFIGVLALLCSLTSFVLWRFLHKRNELI